MNLLGGTNNEEVEQTTVEQDGQKIKAKQVSQMRQNERLERCQNTHSRARRRTMLLSEPPLRRMTTIRASRRKVVTVSNTKGPS